MQEHRSPAWVAGRWYYHDTAPSRNHGLPVNMGTRASMDSESLGAKMKLKDLLSEATARPWVKDHRRTAGHIKSVIPGRKNTPTVCRYDMTFYPEGGEPYHIIPPEEQKANARIIEHWSKTYEPLLEAAKAVADDLAHVDCNCNGKHKVCNLRAKVQAADEVK